MMSFLPLLPPALVLMKCLDKALEDALTKGLDKSALVVGEDERRGMGSLRIEAFTLSINSINKSPPPG